MLEVAGNEVKRNKKSRITPESLRASLKYDE